VFTPLLLLTVLAIAAVTDCAAFSAIDQPGELAGLIDGHLSQPRDAPSLASPSAAELGGAKPVW